MSHFSFAGRRRRFGPNTARVRNNKGTLAGINFGLGLFIVVVARQTPDFQLAALLGLPFLAGGWLVLRERRAGLYLTYFGATLMALIGIASMLLTGRLTIGLVVGFGIYFLTRQAVRFDAYLEDRELEAETAEWERLRRARATPKVSPAEPPRRDRPAR